MSKIADQPIPNALEKIADLLIENRIRIDAMEEVLVKTNPVAYDFYLGIIENLRTRKAAESKNLLQR